VTDSPTLRRARRAGLAALAALAALAGCSLSADNAMTREQGDAILAELKEIHRMLAEEQKVRGKGEAPADTKVEVADSKLQVMGAADAPLTLVEFTDYQCPFCKRFHDRSWPELKAKYVDTGKLRYVIRDLPLGIHAQAMPAAIAARCAGEQGKFWPVHETLFESQATLSPDMILATVKRLGVGSEAFERCRKDPRTQMSIEADIAEAENIGVNGTPGFVLGSRKGEKVAGELILGAQPTEVFSSRIEALLSPAPKAKGAPSS
jgi:protein-disulfide isomerase